MEQVEGEIESVPFGEGIREREALLVEAERIVHLGSWMWDVATSTIRWSDELYRIFGVPIGTLPTQELFFGGIHEADRERVATVATRALERRTPEAIAFRVVRPDGSVRDVQMEAAFVDDPAGHTRMVGTVLDVTDRLALEARLRQSQKLEAIGTLAGGVAHDFNNYLQVVLGSVDLLARHAARGSDLEEGLAAIREAATRAQHLTRQLLLLGRRRVPEPEELSLDGALDAAMPMLTTLVGDRIRIRRVRASSDLRVRIDPGALEQVVLNLAMNARDAMPRGGRVTFDLDTIDVTADEPASEGPNEGTLAPGRYAVISVEDEGVGIPAAALPHIFEPFYTTKADGQGTGLGLATVHGIVSAAGGAIRVTSSSERGTTMRVLLPLVPHTPKSDRPAPVPMRGALLLAEDQPDVRRLVRTILEQEGYEVVEAVDGLDALRWLDLRRDVRIVLSDVSMPKMTGRDLALKLAQTHPRLPVVLMGGVIDSNVAGLAARVLPKPFRREELVAALDDALAPRA
jgi:PAS domain S-box-containing protein